MSHKVSFLSERCWKFFRYSFVYISKNCIFKTLSGAAIVLAPATVKYKSNDALVPNNYSHFISAIERRKNICDKLPQKVVRNMLGMMCKYLQSYQNKENQVIHFQAMFLFYTPLKTLENLRFSDVFRGYTSGTLVENGLKLR